MSEVQNEEDLKRAVSDRGEEYACICKKTGNNQERERESTVALVHANKDITSIYSPLILGAYWCVKLIVMLVV